MGPYFYVNGTVYEGEKKQSQKNSEKLAKWNHAMIACRKNYQPIAEGYLRDIYEINILSKSHLSIEIENMALPDWVAQRSGRGQLKMLNDNLWIWSVLENDISKMQHIFGRAQLTICYGGFETQSATP